MLYGQYYDQVWDRQGKLIADKGWQSNIVVASTWPLLAGLLKNDPALRGILFLAVGAGNPAWDGVRIPASPATEHLADEIGRRAIPAEDIIYLDPEGGMVATPRLRLGLSVSLSWPDESLTLREFGLFGGNATEDRESGYLINYVIHPRIDLAPGATLARRLELRLDARGGEDWLIVPEHWLSGLSIRHMDGIHDQFVAILTQAGITTVGALSRIEPVALNVNMPPMNLVELRAKARLLLRTAATLTVIEGLFGHTARQVIETLPASLAEEANAPTATVAWLREQLSIIQVCLNAPVLARTTVGELVQPL
jgi:hypothetical protein